MFFTSISSIIYDYSIKVKDITMLFLWVILAFPPTIIFILKFQIFYIFTFFTTNLLFIILFMLLLNTFIVYCYLIVLTRLLGNISLM